MRGWMWGWRGGSVVETKVNPLQNVQRREGWREGETTQEPKDFAASSYWRNLALLMTW